MRRAQFKDRRVRQAMSLMFDADWINRALYRGAYQRTVSVFPNPCWRLKGYRQRQSWPCLNPYRAQLPETVFGPAWQPEDSGKDRNRSNLRKAETLLEEAGYGLQGGVLVNAKTKAALQFEILLNDPSDEKLALEYSRSLKRLGITAHIRTIDSAQYTGRIADYDYDMIVYKWISTLSPGSEQLIYWGSKAANMKGSRNYAGIQSPVVDAIAESLTSASDYDDLVVHARALDRVLMNGYFSCRCSTNRQIGWRIGQAGLRRRIKTRFMAPCSKAGGKIIRKIATINKNLK